MSILHFIAVTIKLTVSFFVKIFILKAIKFSAVKDKFSALNEMSSQIRTKDVV